MQLSYSDCCFSSKTPKSDSFTVSRLKFMSSKLSGSNVETVRARLVLGVSVRKIRRDLSRTNH